MWVKKSHIVKVCKILGRLWQPCELRGLEHLPTQVANRIMGSLYILPTPRLEREAGVCQLEPGAEEIGGKEEENGLEVRGMSGRGRKGKDGGRAVRERPGEGTRRGMGGVGSEEG